MIINRIKCFRRDSVFILFSFFLVYFLTFQIMLTRHYSIDAYNYARHSDTQYIGNLELGRICNYFVFGLLKNINIIKYQSTFTLMLMIILTLSAYLLFEHFRKNIENRACTLILAIGILIAYGNVFMIDFFNYIEMVIAWCCGILFMTLAVLQIKEKISLLNAILIFLFTTISINFYQALLGYFICFGLLHVYVISRGKLTLDALKNSILILISGLFSGVINIGLFKILQLLGVVSYTDRTGNIGVKEIIINIRNVIKGMYSLIIDGVFIPRYLLLSVLIVLYIIIITSFVRRKAQYSDYLYLVLLLLCSRLALYAPHFLSTFFWMSPRSLISYWMIVSIPCIIIAVMVEKQQLLRIACIVAVLILIANISSIHKISTNIISTNRIDEEIAYEIHNAIQNYENESGNIIEKIVFRNDEEPRWGYNSVKFQVYELCERAYVVPWACVECINYFNGTSYDYELMSDEEFNKYYSIYNWDTLNLPEQLVFENNTMYYVAY